MLTNISGPLQPRTMQPDDEKPDLIHAVDASGVYQGVVPSADGLTEVIPPPGLFSLDVLRWDFDNSTWKVVPTVDEQCRAIEEQRDATIDAGVEFNGIQWYADTVFIQHINAYLTMFQEGIIPDGGTAEVRAMDKVIYNLSRDDLRGLSVAVMQHVKAAYEASWSAKAALGD
jgi:hypothetical protein